MDIRLLLVFLKGVLMVTVNRTSHDFYVFDFLDGKDIEYKSSVEDDCRQFYLCLLGNDLKFMCLDDFLLNNTPLDSVECRSEMDLPLCDSSPSSDDKRRRDCHFLRLSVFFMQVICICWILHVLSYVRVVDGFCRDDLYCIDNSVCNLVDQVCECDVGHAVNTENYCDPVECGPLVNPADGYVDTSAGTEYTDVATYSCHVGFTVNGISSRTCQASGEWNGTVPSCDIVDCGPLAPPLHARIDTSAGTTYTMVATYSCDEGYALTGSATRSCEASGSWSNGEPNCNCPSVNPIDIICYPNATLLVPNPNTIVFKTVFAIAENGSYCTATWEDSTYATVRLEDCYLDTDISVHFADRWLNVADGPLVNGGTTISIRCNEIDSVGVAFVESHGFGVTLSTAPEVSKTPTLNPVLALRNSNGEVVSQADVGDTLQWCIDIPDEYTVMPMTCTAYSGTDSTSTGYKDIVLNGCSTDYSLIDDFDATTKVRTDISHLKRYYSLFYVFKFYNSEYVYLQCVLRVCPFNSLHCSFDCDRRRKRQLPYRDFENAATYRTAGYMIHIRDFPIYGHASMTVASRICFVAVVAVHFLLGT